MAKQDDWARITLRLPPELHDKLVKAAGAGSLNAAIVERLRDSFELEDLVAEPINPMLLQAADDAKATAMQTLAKAVADATLRALNDILTGPMRKGEKLMHAQVLKEVERLVQARTDHQPTAPAKSTKP